LLSSCVPALKLAEGDNLLYKQNIKGCSQFSPDDLALFFKQKPNRRLVVLPLTPYLYAYEIGKKFYTKNVEGEKNLLDSLQKYTAAKREEIDFLSGKERKKAEKALKKLSKKIADKREYVEKGNWLMRSVGEPPAIVDSALTQQVAEQMQLFMRQRGYFSANVSLKYILTGRLQTVNFMVSEGEAHIIRKLNFSAKDDFIHQILDADSAHSLIKIGQIYNEEKLTNERNRVLNLLRDKGFYNFGQQYILAEADTFTGIKNTVDLTFFVENPPRNAHKRYVFGNLEFYSDLQSDTSKLRREKSDEAQYLFFKKKYSVKVLNERISLKKDTVFSFKEVIETQRKLLDLNIFKFANIYFDTLGDKILPKISATSFPKYNLTTETGVNFMRYVPGPFVSLGLTNRNLLGACELFNIQARALLEYTLDNQDGKTRYRWSREISSLATLTIPKFLLPLSRDVRLRLYRYNPQTQFVLGFTHIYRPQYIRNNFNAVFRYNWNFNRNTDFRINLLDFGFNFTDYVSKPFFEYLKKLWRGGNNLVYSFQSSVVANISAQYLYSNNRTGNVFKTGKYLNVLGEFGMSYASDILSQIHHLDSIFFEKNTYIPNPFVRFQIDGRRYKLLNRKTMFAARLHFALTMPLKTGGNLVGIPYQKYQFLGGSNSIRAWTPRRLGPGSVQFFDDSGNLDYTLERPGELLFEGSVELRRKLFKVIEIAAFADAGNLWMLSQSFGEGSMFRSDEFYKEFALGSGLGIRFDFSFLVMRMDYAVKVYDPAFREGARWVIRDFKFGNPFSPNSGSNLNIAIGYPF
jgi:hypothetical protein